MATIRRKQPRGRDRTALLLGALAVFLCFVVSAPYWATDEAGARAAIEAMGWEPVEVGGFDNMGCGLDLYATRFVARNGKGRTVRGNVCRTPGISKSSIEIDTGDAGR